MGQGQKETAVVGKRSKIWDYQEQPMGKGSHGGLQTRKTARRREHRIVHDHFHSVHL